MTDCRHTQRDKLHRRPGVGIREPLAMDVVEIGYERRKHGLVKMRVARWHSELESLAFVTQVCGELDLPGARRHRVRLEPRMRFGDQSTD